MRASRDAVSTFRRWMLGFFCMAALAGLGAAYAVHAWMAAVDAQTPSVTIVGPTTRGALHFRVVPDHAQTRALLDASMRRLVAASRDSDQLPLLSRWMLSRAESQMIPTDLTITFGNARLGQDPTLTAAVNLQGYPRLFAQVANAAYRLSSTSDGASTREYNGSRLIGEQPTLCMKQGTVLLASDSAGMMRALDTLQASSGDAVPLRALLDRVADTDDAVGVYDNADDSLGAVLPLMRVDETHARAFSSVCAHLGAGVVVEGPDRLRVSIDLTPRRGGSVALVRTLATRVLEDVARASAEGGLAVTFQTSAGAGVARVVVTLEGVQAVLSRLQGLMAEVGIAQTPSPSP